MTTVLQVLVGTVFVLSVLAGLLVAGPYLIFNAFRGVHEGCFGERLWAPTLASWGFVGAFVTGIPLAVWVRSPAAGLLTLFGTCALAVAVWQYGSWRERRWRAAHALSRDGAAGGELC